MPRLHFVKKARKTIRGTGIKRGDSYFWWRFRVNGRSGVKQVSKTRPRRSQLTRSPFLQAMYNAEDGLVAAAEQFASGGDHEDFLVAIEQAIETVREEASSCQEKYDNQPESFRDGVPGALLKERQECCERIADELDNVKADVENEELGKEEDQDDWVAKVSGFIEVVDWSLP